MGQYGYQNVGGSPLDVSSVAGSLPIGPQLGDVKIVNGIKYRLFFNDGGDVIYPGYMFKAKGAGQGPYSVTVTTTTESVSGIKGVVLNATATTNTYFWGAVYGHPVKMAASNISIATGVFVGPALGGQCITTTTTAHFVGLNVGDATTATATTNATASGTAVGSRFFVFFEDRPAWTSN